MSQKVFWKWFGLTFGVFLLVGLALNWGHAAPPNVSGSLFMLWLLVGLPLAWKKAKLSDPEKAPTA